MTAWILTHSRFAKGKRLIITRSNDGLITIPGSIARDLPGARFSGREGGWIVSNRSASLFFAAMADRKISGQVL